MLQRLQKSLTVKKPNKLNEILKNTCAVSYQELLRSGGDESLANLLDLDYASVEEEEQAYTWKPVLDTQIPILRAYSTSPFLNKKDFQRLNLDVSFKTIIKGRYAGNMVFSNDYYLQFQSLEDMQKYYHSFLQNHQKTGTRIDGRSYFSLSDTNDLVNRMRFMYTHMTIDLDDLPDIAKYASSSTVVDSFEGKKDAEKSFAAFMKAKINMLHRVRPKQPGLSNIANHIWRRKYDKIVPQQLVNRSDCVVLSNVHNKISVDKIKDFYWDLNWHHETFSSNIRHIITDKTSHMSTYVLVFADAVSAQRCVARTNNYPLFLNPENSITHAELL